MPVLEIILCQQKDQVNLLVKREVHHKFKQEAEKWIRRT